MFPGLGHLPHLWATCCWCFAALIKKFFLLSSLNLLSFSLRASCLVLLLQTVPFFLRSPLKGHNKAPQEPSLQNYPTSLSLSLQERCSISFWVPSWITTHTALHRLHFLCVPFPQQRFLLKLFPAEIRPRGLRATLPGAVFCQWVFL